MLFLLGFAFFLNTSAKPVTNSFSLKATILDDSTGKGVGMAHIFNESARLGTISNQQGEFTLPSSHGDTLVISAIGYYGKLVFLDDSSQRIEVRLIPQSYEIDAVSVRAFGDYADFRRRFLALELNKTATDQLRQELGDIAQRVGVNAYTKMRNEEILKNQIGLMPRVSVPLYSRYERQLMNLAKIKQKEEKQRIINKKYNRKIIRRVTLLNTDDEITEFMSFCNFSEDLLYYMSEYDILVLIERKFQEYKLLNLLIFPFPSELSDIPIV